MNDNRFIEIILLIATIIALATLWAVHVNRPHPKCGIEHFEDVSSGNVNVSGGTLTAPLPTNKRLLLADVLDAVRAEVTRLTGLKSSDATVLTRIQNLTNIRNTLQQMYADLMEGRIKESDIDFSPDEVADFLPALGPDADLSQPLPELSTKLLEPVTTTLRTMKDSSIYWSMELGIQNYNPRPPPSIRVANADQLADAITSAGAPIVGDDTRGGNALFSSNSFITGQQQPEDWTQYGRPGKSGSMIASAGNVTNNSTNDVGTLDYKQRLTDTCDAIRAGQLGDPADFGCMKKGTEVGPTFDYKGRYQLVCERLGYTWGSGYQQMLGCQGDN